MNTNPGTAESALRADVAKAVGGDRSALERVVRAAQPLVSRLALRFFGCPRHAEDAAQEALVQLVTKLDRFDGQSAFFTWVYRVATNKFLSLVRSPAERQQLAAEEFDEELAQPLQEQPDRNGDSEHALLLAEVRIGCTLAMLLCLDRKTRLAYILGEITELDHEEAAAVLECSPAAYRKRLERARVTITGLMRRRCGVYDASNACRCADRVPIAAAKGRLHPDNLLFATSREQVAQFPEVLVQIRRLETARRAAAVYRSHPDPAVRADFASFLDQLLTEGERALQG